MLGALLGIAGCHLLAGYDGLELREDPEPLWSRAWGDPDESMEPLAQVVQDVAARDLDTYIAGELEGTMTLGMQTLASNGSKDVFVAALDDLGIPRWSQSFGTAGEERVRSVLATGDRVFVMGTFAGNLPLGGEMLMSPAGESFYLAELDRADGRVRRARQSSGGLELISTKLDTAADDEGGLIVVGGFGGTLGFGSPCETHDAMGAMDVFIARITDAGCAWSKGLGDDLSAAESVAVDGGDIVVAGEFLGSLEFDPQTRLESGGGIDIFVVKLTRDGEHQWHRHFGDPGGGIQSSVRVAVHQFGSVTIAGYFKGTLDFGGGPMSSSIGHDLYVAKLDPSGAHLWSKHFATERPECIANDCDLDRIALVVDAQGDVLLSAHFQGTIDFGGTTHTSSGSTDLFVAKLKSENGSLLWSGTFGDERAQCTPPECLVSAAVDAADNVVLGGYFDGSVDFGFGPHPSAGAHDAFVVKMRP